MLSTLQLGMEVLDATLPQATMELQVRGTGEATVASNYRGIIMGEVAKLCKVLNIQGSRE